MSDRATAAALTPRASAHLDMLRGLAAITVLVGHVRGMLFTDLQALGPGWKSPLLNAVYFVTSLGHQAVMMFFVLSGFFIGRSVLGSLSDWSWLPYVVNRLTRLYVVLIPALVLTAAVDYLARSFAAGPMYYAQAIPHFNAQPYVDRLDLATFAGNLVFLQTVYVGPFGSNSPLWSLANEFWYYALFPLLALTMTVRDRKRRAALAIAFVAMGLWLPGVLVASFAIWLLGVAVHWLPPIDARQRPVVARLTVIGAWLALALASVTFFRIDSGVGDFTVGATAAAVVYAIVRVQWNRRAPSPIYTRTATRLAGCSFSVYAIHFPLVMIVRVAMGTGTWLPSALHLALGAALCAGIVGCGALFARLTEANTGVVRRRVMKRLERRRPDPVVVAG